MPGVNPPRVPEGLRDLMKSLTKEVLREKPPNVYEFSAQYFESILDEKRDFTVKGFEPPANYENFHYRERNQIPLSLVYTIIPEGLTELIKEFIKAVLRANPSNICEFAVEYFRGLRKDENVDSCSIEYTAYENYFKSKDRFSFTPYLKCTCGRKIGDGMTQEHYETKTEVSVVSSGMNLSPQNKKIIQKIREDDVQQLVDENECNVEKDSNTIEKQNKNDSNIIKVDNDAVNELNSKSVTTIDEGEKYIHAIFVIQRFFRKCLLKKANSIKEPGNNSTQKSVSTSGMTEETAAIVIQRSLRKLFNGKFQKHTALKTTPLVPKLENIHQNEEPSDNVSEAASYTSASTALMSAESVGENSEIGMAIYDEGILHKTIMEDEEVENDYSNNSNEYSKINETREFVNNANNAIKSDRINENPNDSKEELVNVKETEMASPRLDLHDTLNTDDGIDSEKLSNIKNASTTKSADNSKENNLEVTNSVALPTAENNINEPISGSVEVTTNAVKALENITENNEKITTVNDQSENVTSENTQHNQTAPILSESINVDDNSKTIEDQNKTKNTNAETDVLLEMEYNQVLKNKSQTESLFKEGANSVISNAENKLKDEDASYTPSKENKVIDITLDVQENIETEKNSKELMSDPNSLKDEITEMKSLNNPTDSTLNEEVNINNITSNIQQNFENSEKSNKVEPQTQTPNDKINELKINETSGPNQTDSGIKILENSNQSDLDVLTPKYTLENNLREDQNASAQKNAVSSSNQTDECSLENKTLDSPTASVLLKKTDLEEASEDNTLHNLAPNDNKNTNKSDLEISANIDQINENDFAPNDGGNSNENQSKDSTSKDDLNNSNETILKFTTDDKNSNEHILEDMTSKDAMVNLISDDIESSSKDSDISKEVNSEVNKDVNSNNSEQDIKEAELAQDDLLISISEENTLEGLTKSDPTKSVMTEVNSEVLQDVNSSKSEQEILLQNFEKATLAQDNQSTSISEENILEDLTKSEMKSGDSVFTNQTEKPMLKGELIHVENNFTIKDDDKKTVSDLVLNDDISKKKDLDIAIIEDKILNDQTNSGMKNLDSPLENQEDKLILNKLMSDERDEDRKNISDLKDSELTDKFDASILEQNENISEPRNATNIWENTSEIHVIREKNLAESDLNELALNNQTELISRKKRSLSPQNTSVTKDENNSNEITLESSTLTDQKDKLTKDENNLNEFTLKSLTLTDQKDKLTIGSAPDSKKEGQSNYIDLDIAENEPILKAKSSNVHNMFPSKEGLEDSDILHETYKLPVEDKVIDQTENGTNNSECPSPKYQINKSSLEDKTQPEPLNILNESISEIHEIEKNQPILQNEALSVQNEILTKNTENFNDVPVSEDTNLSDVNTNRAFSQVHALKEQQQKTSLEDEILNCQTVLKDEDTSKNGEETVLQSEIDEPILEKKLVSNQNANAPTIDKAVYDQNLSTEKTDDNLNKNSTDFTTLNKQGSEPTLEHKENPKEEAKENDSDLLLVAKINQANELGLKNESQQDENVSSSNGLNNQSDIFDIAVLHNAAKKIQKFFREYSNRNRKDKIFSELNDEEEKNVTLDSSNITKKLNTLEDNSTRNQNETISLISEDISHDQDDLPKANQNLDLQEDIDVIQNEIKTKNENTDIGILTSDSIIGTQNSHENINEIDSSEKSINNNQSNLKKENSTTKHDSTGRFLPIAEIHLKSFKLSDSMEALPWYDAMTITNETGVKNNDTSSTQGLPKTEIETSISSNDMKKYDVFYQESDTEFSDSLNEVNFERDSLEIASSSKETDMDEDSLELEHSNNNEIAPTNLNIETERTATYLYGIHTPRQTPTQQRKVYKSPTAFTIPFNDNISTQSKELDVNNQVHIDPKNLVQNESTDTNTLSSEKSNSDKPIEHTNMTNKEMLSLDLSKTDGVEVQLDMETPTQLFAELNAFDLINDEDFQYTMEATYTPEEKINLNFTGQPNNTKLHIDEPMQNENDIYLAKFEVNQVNETTEEVPQESLLHTIEEDLNESVTPRPDYNTEIITKDLASQLNKQNTPNGSEDQLDNVSTEENDSEFTSSWTCSKDLDETFLSDEYINENDEEATYYRIKRSTPTNATEGDAKGGIYEIDTNQHNLDDKKENGESDDETLQDFDIKDTISLNEDLDTNMFLNNNIKLQSTEKSAEVQNNNVFDVKVTNTEPFNQKINSHEEEFNNNSENNTKNIVSTDESNNLHDANSTHKPNNNDEKSTTTELTKTSDNTNDHSKQLNEEIGTEQQNKNMDVQSALTQTLVQIKNSEEMVPIADNTDNTHSSNTNDQSNKVNKANCTEQLNKNMDAKSTQDLEETLPVRKTSINEQSIGNTEATQLYNKIEAEKQTNLNDSNSDKETLQNISENKTEKSNIYSNQLHNVDIAKQSNNDTITEPIIQIINSDVILQNVNSKNNMKNSSDQLHNDQNVEKQYNDNKSFNDEKFVITHPLIQKTDSKEKLQKLYSESEIENNNSKDIQLDISDSTEKQNNNNKSAITGSDEIQNSDLKNTQNDINNQSNQMQNRNSTKDAKNYDEKSAITEPLKKKVDSEETSELNSDNTTESNSSSNYEFNQLHNEDSAEHNNRDELHESLQIINQRLSNTEKLIEESVAEEFSQNTDLKQIENTIADLKISTIQLGEFENLISQAPTPPQHDPDEDIPDNIVELTNINDVVLLHNAAKKIQKYFRNYLNKKGSKNSAIQKISDNDFENSSEEKNNYNNNSNKELNLNSDSNLPFGKSDLYEYSNIYDVTILNNAAKKIQQFFREYSNRKKRNEANVKNIDDLTELNSESSFPILNIKEKENESSEVSEVLPEKIDSTINTKEKEHQSENIVSDNIKNKNISQEIKDLDEIMDSKNTEIELNTSNDPNEYLEKPNIQKIVSHNNLIKPTVNDLYDEDSTIDYDSNKNMKNLEQAAIIIQKYFKSISTRGKLHGGPNRISDLEKQTTTDTSINSNNEIKLKYTNEKPTSIERRDEINDEAKNMAALTIQNAFRNYVNRRVNKSDNKTSTDNSWDESQITEIYVGNITSSNNSNHEDSKYGFDNNIDPLHDNESGIKNNMALTVKAKSMYFEPTAPEEHELAENDLENQTVKVNWFVGNEPIESTMKRESDAAKDNISLPITPDLYGSSSDNNACSTNLNTTSTAPLVSPNINSIATVKVDCTSSSFENDNLHNDTSIEKLNNFAEIVSALEYDNIEVKNANSFAEENPINDAEEDNIKNSTSNIIQSNSTEKESEIKSGELNLQSKQILSERSNNQDSNTEDVDHEEKYTKTNSLDVLKNSTEENTMALKNTKSELDNETEEEINEISQTAKDFIAAERSFSEPNKEKDIDFKSTNIINSEATASDDGINPDIMDFINSEKDDYSDIPYEKLEEPCIKKSVSLTHLDKSISNEIENESIELKVQDDTESTDSPDDNLDAITDKLRQTEGVIEKMQQRRLSETKSLSVEEKTAKNSSFEEPIIRSMQKLQERNNTQDVADDEVIVLSRLQHDDTRESSAQSDSVVFGGDDNNGDQDVEEDFNESAIKNASLKRLHTIAGDDPKILFKSVTIDDTIKYIEPPESETTATSDSSFCLDDDTSENIRQKMMAYSLSEADSDFFNSMDKTKVNHDDFNISTALLDTGGTSTDTESTIVSAATKIQAGARGFLTRRRLRRASAGTKSSLLDEKASFGNDAISESLEKLIEYEAAKKIQHAYRMHYRQRKAAHSGSDDDDFHSTSLAARRLTLQRGDALRNDSTPDEENSANGNVKDSANETSNMTLALAGNEQDTSSNSKTVSETATEVVADKRSKKVVDNNRKWLALRQNSMPVQIDCEIFRVIPKHMRKRIKSAEGVKKGRRIIYKD